MFFWTSVKPHCSICFENVYVAIMLRLLLVRFSNVTWPELYQICPSLRPRSRYPVNCGYGRARSQREIVSEEKRVVPRNGSSPKNGLGRRSSQNAGEPPSSGLHFWRMARSGSLNWRSVWSLMVRLPTYATSIFELQGSSYWNPSEN